MYNVQYRYPYTAPNGMNLSRSVRNPRSRFSRIYTYLAVQGESTKKEILANVFGKTVGMNYLQGEISKGWGTYVFGLGVKYGYFRKVQKNNSVYWSIA